MDHMRTRHEIMESASVTAEPGEEKSHTEGKVADLVGERAAETIAEAKLARRAHHAEAEEPFSGSLPVGEPGHQPHIGRENEAADEFAEKTHMDL